MAAAGSTRVEPRTGVCVVGVPLPQGALRPQGRPVGAAGGWAPQCGAGSEWGFGGGTQSSPLGVEVVRRRCRAGGWGGTRSLEKQDK